MESVACNLCGSTSASHWLTSVDRVTGEAFDILRCRRCGLRYTSPRPSADEMAAYYPEPAAPSWPAQAMKRWLRRRRARWSAAGLRPGRALDIGCGSGWMLDALREAGWDVAGIERNEESATRPRRLGLDVHVGDVTRGHVLSLSKGSVLSLSKGSVLSSSKGGFPAASFDLVILWHTLEHLHDPLATLTEVRRLLCPAGRLVVAVPNVDSWQARVAGQRWVHLDVPRHLYHFDPATLDLMLRRAGFQVQTWSWVSPAYEYRGWWELLTVGAGVSVAAFALASLIAPLAMVLSAIAAHRKASATMAVQAFPALVP